MRLFLGGCALATFAGAAFAQQPADSLRLSRRQTVAEALNRNAQLEIAREQVAQARGRRVTAIAVPDPQASAAFDQLTGPFSFGNAPARPVSLSLNIPWFDKFKQN